MLATVRRRVTFIAFMATAATLTVAAVVLLIVLRGSLVAEVDSQISNRAFDAAVEIELTNELDNASFPNDPETFLGIVERYPGEAPLLDIHNDEFPDVDEVLGLLGESGYSGELRWDEPGDGALPSVSLTEGVDNLRVVFTEVEPGAEIIVAARTLDGVDRTVAQVRTGALFAVPILTLLVSLLVYELTGRALRPVEGIRAEVETISGSDLARRVEVGDRPDEISRLAATMNGMLARLESAQERQRRFAGDAAHELRSPLASMKANLEVDLAHPETADWNRSAAHLRSEVDRMQRMVEDLMLLARSDADARPDPAAQRLVDLDDLVLTEVASLARPDGVEVGTSQVSAASVRGNPDHLRRVITNLLANGVRHATSMVVVTVAERDGRALVVVDDDGAGIAPQDRDRVFERFVRLDEARSRDAGGSGLGLALAREVAIAHGGSLSVDANERNGARFVLSLPAA